MQLEPQLWVVYLADHVGAHLPILEAKLKLLAPKLVSIQAFSGNVVRHMMWAERRLLDDMHNGHKALVRKLQQLVLPTKDSSRPYELWTEQQQLTSFDKFWTMEKNSKPMLLNSFSRKLSMKIGSNSNMQQQDQAPGSDSSFHPGHSSIAGYLAKVAPPSHTNIDGYLPNPRQPGSDSSLHPRHSSIAGYLAKIAPPSHTNIDGYLRKHPNPMVVPIPN